MRCHRALLALGAACALAATVAAQELPKAQAPFGCPATAQDVPMASLYGRWEAHFDGLPAAAVVQLERHPDYEGVRGTIARTASLPVAQLAGDIDDEGQLAIDESQDGRSISGVWSGTLVPGSCGREFKGTFRNAIDDSTHAFVLSKTGPSK